MAKQRSKRSRNLRRATALALGAGGLLALVRRSAAGRSWSTDEDPCGPDGLMLPVGEQRVIAMDDGAELAVTITGPADGPAVVLAHCWTGSRAIWSPVARLLAAEGHRVVLYDQRGHGASSFGEERTDMERLGEDLRTVLETLDLTDVVLVGHSMGGMTIQALAKEHPAVVRERTRAVVLVATAAKVTARAVPLAAIEAVIGDRALAPWFRGAGGIVATRGAHGSVAHRSHVAATRDHFIDTAAGARTGFLAAMTAMDLRPGVANLTVPTTILVGSEDRMTPPKLARQLAALAPDGELVVLDGAGHMLPLEAPAEVAAAIRAHTAVGEARAKASLN